MLYIQQENHSIKRN